MFNGMSGSVLPCSTRSSDENNVGCFSASSTSARVFSSTAPSIPIAPCATSAWFMGCGIVVSVPGVPAAEFTKSTFATGASARFGSPTAPPCVQVHALPAYTEEALPLSYPRVSLMSNGCS